jgi:UDP-N-acetyl-D-glucosamine dehydrogenase
MTTTIPKALDTLVVGQGYVGLPLAIRAAEVGHTVVGFDVDESRIKRLLDGDSFIEDIAAEQLKAALENGRYRPTADPTACAGFDVAVITVPTPLQDGVPDLRFIQDAARTLAPHVRASTTVILESTTYPGTTEELLVPLLEEGSHLRAGRDFHIGFSPERIDPGNREWTLINTPKVVSGIDPDSLTAVRSFYDTLVERTVPVRSTKEAELTKLLENTFRHVNIALVNELAALAAELDIDIWEVIDAASTKPFGFMRFTPGPGVGGHCLPIDPSYLAWRVERRLGRPFRFVALAKDVNDHMPDYIVQRVILGLNRRRRAVNGARILLLGLAYKRNTADHRESPAIAVAQQLVALGGNVRAVDPHVAEDFVLPTVARVALTAEELEAADAVVVLTDHELLDRELVGKHARYVFDTRHWLDGANDQVEFL